MVPQPTTCPIAATANTPMSFLLGSNFLLGSKNRLLSPSPLMPDRPSEAPSGQDEQHHGRFIVETFDLAALDVQRAPLAGACISGSQPIGRRIIVITIERVAAF